ncbi:energy transducer TonB [Candidatus Methylacidiphilum fumarolicum]|uniref:Periplasmic protein TonB n=2 Tax=Candidatus Methylacidiphilum fumarolicum TaxID=591154 RepID=I0K033_METFB|nr:energy transducer TonB [Candidatus Methylacidiphilum fumarolicum]MBW6415123.1 energy transducer TonB [Candidatus Methylacidiphilum fumarolicum]TFE65995.1 energy transducer TonB [Candidatus Methylacidiphilum fumarolicum]TFE72723.1 energy transducer TonB [Candidatus Methylacidiphilum fumarolicum]TFE73189.1 energy transducer TonB [Candidatus Methylacidiphilum fumarolicum]TFE77595.1 energy transducer TonB [Candidatus Methylacidiphilum fumarolicum]
MERNDYIGYFLSLLIHATLLFIVGYFFIQKVEYGITAGEATVDVDLINVPETPIPPEPVPTPIPEEMAQPQEAPKPVVQPPPKPKAVQKPKGIPQATKTPAGKMTMPGYLRNPAPAYPAAAKAAGHQGLVILRVHVSSSGYPTSVTIGKSSGYPELDQAAENTVKKFWRFKPPTMLGLPIDVDVDIPIRFKIN